MRLSADEFIKRFLLHVLPKGFHRIRHCGLLDRPVEHASSGQSAIITGFQPSAILKQTIPRQRRCRDKSP
jgi:hypothetical protein